ncbi:MAG: hypothetical protein JAZ17_00260 [Candidatus Thiodiazotropha endolucinida]|nr:hypothetical protein [Candidatus Thiodiazotropha endolucinida]
MKRGLLLVWAVVMGGCEVFSVSPTCSEHESPVFVLAWEEQLNEKGIPYSKKNKRTLCFEADHGSEAHKARLATEHVFRGAAMIVDTANEREQLFEYIGEENREYNEMPLDRGRTFVVVYSSNRVELDETQVMLSCIERHSDCLQ